MPLSMGPSPHSTSKLSWSSPEDQAQVPHSFQKLFASEFREYRREWNPDHGVSNSNSSASYTRTCSLGLMCWVWKQRRARLEAGNGCSFGCLWAALFSTYAIVVVSENLLFPLVQFQLFLSSSCFHFCNCSCFWAVVYRCSCFWAVVYSCSCFWAVVCSCSCFWAVVYSRSCFWAVVKSCSCFWVALLSICTIYICFWGSLFIVNIIVVVSRQFPLPYVHLSPTFTIISPEGIFYYNTDKTPFTPSSTLHPLSLFPANPHFLPEVLL